MEKNRKVGRPEKEKKRDIQKNLYFTIDEYHDLLVRFHLSNYSKISDMLRDNLLTGELKVVTTDNEMFVLRNELLHEIKRIGNNFNQLIKSFNQKKTDNFTNEDKEKILFYMKNIEEVYNKIHKIQ